VGHLVGCSVRCGPKRPPWRVSGLLNLVGLVGVGAHCMDVLAFMRSALVSPNEREVRKLCRKVWLVLNIYYCRGMLALTDLFA
jgi:hypothetical protein